jgi:BlaI family transcriptional regulator, penicillinase repressor
MDISNAEYEVLAALWQQHPASANDIIGRLNQDYEKSVGAAKSWHEKTVKTLLSRLVKKNAISYEKQQRRYLYTPLLERENYTIKESKNLIEKLFSGRISPLVAGFAKNSDLKKDDIEELKAVIARWEKQNSEQSND